VDTPSIELLQAKTNFEEILASRGLETVSISAADDGISTLEGPALLEYAATCNDPSGFEVRKHVGEAHERRDIRTIARRRKRAASGGGMRRGSFPRPDFRSPSSHRASGIVRNGGDQMPSRQLFDSSRFDRDHLTASERRAAPRATRCSPRNARGELSAQARMPPRERHSRGCFFEVGPTARTSALMRAPRRSPPTVNRRSRHPRAAPTRTKLLAFDRWSFPGDSQPGPRRDMVHRPSAAPSPGTAASRAQTCARGGREIESFVSP
jgi:hypothetical protein